jgi:fibrillarin-like pre-rRNA processing protein
LQDVVELLSGVYILDLDGRIKIATRPLVLDSVYGEMIFEGYRIWDPRRSKLAALLLKRYEAEQRSAINSLGLVSDRKVLYLGAATGTTVSHMADIVCDGLIYAVEFSPRSMRDLLRLCEARHNIIPVLEDATRPERYSALVEPVDIIYQDVAQRDQAGIANKNANRYLKPGGTLILMIKTRSIDVTRPPREVYHAETDRLEGFDVIEELDLWPYHRDHWAIVAKKKY